VTASLLAITDLYCERDDRVLFENLSLQLNQGQIVHLVGKNGSGKTSLLRILSGLYHSYEGSVKYLGQDISHVRNEYNKALLYIAHNVSVKGALTVRENLDWYSKIQPQLDSDMIQDAITSVGLNDFDDVLCHHLSAGQKRRVNLARLYMLPVSAFENSLWILDEPYTAIDVEGVASLENHLQGYVSEGGAVILTTHQFMHRTEAVVKINLDELGT
jgi:heme exporter protein A